MISPVSGLSCGREDERTGRLPQGQKEGESATNVGVEGRQGRVADEGGGEDRGLLERPFQAGEELLRMDVEVLESPRT